MDEKVKSDLSAINQRTSLGQLRSIACFVMSFFAMLARHIYRFRGSYSFIAGAVSTLLCLAAIIWYGVFAFPLPWKITDPHDPRFNPQNFQFTDYSNSRELSEVLRVMFPVGTEKEVVDRALSRAGATIRKYTPAKNEKIPKNLYYYSYRNFRSVIGSFLAVTTLDDSAWKVGIYYDENETVTSTVGISP